MNLSELVERNAHKFAERDCVRAGGEGWSFSLMAELSVQAAGLLQSWGVEKGDKVAVMGLNTPWFVAALYGVARAGAALVPINHKLAAPEVEYIVNHSDAKVLLFDADLAEVAGRVATEARKATLAGSAEGYEDLPELLRNAPAHRPVSVEDDDPAEILYTSGTTGRPKGCVHSHRNVLLAGITGALAVKMEQADRLLMAMPLWHSSPLNNWFMGIQWMGGTTVLIPEYHPLHFLEAIQEERCTVYFGAPISYIMPLQMIPNFDEYELGSMRAWIYGGGPIGAETARMLIERYQSDRFYQVYGMTEAGPTGTTLLPDEQVEKAGSIGRTALPGADLRVMKEDGSAAGPGEEGEIWLEADCMMQEYYKDPEASEEAFEGSWYRTGDVARMDEDGYLFIVDRTKDMIVTGGENVYSKEVEDVLAAHPGVVEAAVVGRPHPDWGESVAAFLVAGEDGPPGEEELTAFCADQLARYKIPREYRFVSELPHTPTGKVKKFELREGM